MAENTEIDVTEVTPVEDIVQKLNESFEAKLNAAISEAMAQKDTEITGLRAEIDALVQKHNEAEVAVANEKAEADFKAFSMRLNKAHQKDAQVHYDGFKAEGFGYFDAHPDVFKTDIPKMNARGVPEAGEQMSDLAKARAELQKTLRQRK